MSKIGFGIIGCGNISSFHAQAIQLIPQAHLVAFYDEIPARAEKRAGEFKVEWVSSLQDLLSRSDIQVVSICTPSGTHSGLGIKVAQAGKHVIVEKPIDVTLEKAQALVDACDKAGVKLAAIFQSRFLPAVRILKKAIDRGRLGRLIMGDAYIKWFRTREYYESTPWRGTWALDGGGALMNQSIHTIDLLQYLMGPVASLFGFTEKKLHVGIEAEDTAAAVLKFKNGAIGVIEGTTSLYPGFSRRIEVHGEKGSVILDGNDIAVWKLDEVGEEEEELKQMTEKDTSNASADPLALDVAGHRRQIEDLVDALQNNRDPAISGREGLKAIEIILAIYQSSREKRMVEI